MNETDRELMDRFLDDDLSPAEQAALIAKIEGDRDGVAQLAERAWFHAELRQVLRRDALRRFALAAVSGSEPGEVRKIVVVPRTRVRRVLAWATAACLVLTGWLVWRPDTSVPVEVVEADQGTAFVGGQRLALRNLTLPTGHLLLRLESGVLLDVSGPAAMCFEDAMRLRLLRGRLNADVGERGKGFTVLTDAGEVVDLGTRFGVEAGADGESRVAVFSGEVKVRSGAAGGEFTTLHEGEAVRFTALAGLRRWTQVALAVDATGMERAPVEGVVAAVRDNLGDEELHPFYGVVRGGLRPGALAFTDKPNPRWAPGLGDSLPAWLEGADLVRTYHQFRFQRGYELTLTLREAATVFVLFDSRQEPPTWLRERFEESGARVRVGPWMPGMAGAEGIEVADDGRPYLTFAVWRAEVPAGEFTLGPAHDRKDKKLPFALMYGVAVKAR